MGNRIGLVSQEDLDLRIVAIDSQRQFWLSAYWVPPELNGYLALFLEFPGEKYRSQHRHRQANDLAAVMVLEEELREG